VAGPLVDPTLELRDRDGAIVATNDDWATDDGAAKLIALGLAPDDPRESALYRRLSAAAYTAIVRGKNDESGVGLVETFNVRDQ
jgi:hypothetical protein